MDNLCDRPVHHEILMAYAYIVSLQAVLATCTTNSMLLTLNYHQPASLGLRHICLPILVSVCSFGYWLIILQSASPTFTMAKFGGHRKRLPNPAASVYTLYCTPSQIRSVYSSRSNERLVLRLGGGRRRQWQIEDRQ